MDIHPSFIFFGPGYSQEARDFRNFQVHKWHFWSCAYKALFSDSASSKTSKIKWQIFVSRVLAFTSSISLCTSLRLPRIHGSGCTTPPLLAQFYKCLWTVLPSLPLLLKSTLHPVWITCPPFFLATSLLLGHFGSVWSSPSDGKRRK